MGCCEDTAVPAAQEDAALPAAHEGIGCSPFDAPPQNEPKGGLHSEDLCSCGEGGIQGTPARGKDIIRVPLIAGVEYGLQ